MPKLWMLVAVAGLTVPVAAVQAQIYRCDGPGGTVFSQTPCAPSARVVEIAPSPVDDDNAETQRARAAAAHERSQQQLERERHDRAVRRVQGEIHAMEDARDRELSDVRARRARASNNLAGATWEQALAAEEQAIVQRYSVQIQTLHNELLDLRRRAP